ncbi:uncharacterized protein LOC121554560 isoform X1 [Coregonus clupeaformis]|uniref:uncharacterized protein LOC121554560 isoform X1 n=1 Tax=Coregonus clupeaformis TaxID=59861 RepID=UPI001E1C8C24|nr:uncharacterized protein LOC121554560 isoform X1 [Coregonus clupeaformis]
MGWKLLYCLFTLMVGLLVSTECPSISNGIILKTVNLKNTVNLPCNATCDIGIVREILDGQVVAKIDQGKLIEGNTFEKRVKINNDLSLTIISAVYNDKGLYECICHTRTVADVHLDVLVPPEISADFGDNVTLPCYGSTNKQATDGEMHVQWDKDGQTVLKIDPTNTTYGPGFMNRTSVTRDGYREGDLSLIITNVHSSDKGTYLCFFNRHSDPGYPHGVTLTVKENRLESTTSETTTTSETSGRSRLPLVVCLVECLVICVLVVVICKSKQRPPTMDDTITGTEDNAMVTLGPLRLSTEETPLPAPVQESEPVTTDRQMNSDDHPDENMCPERVGRIHEDELPVMRMEHTEEEEEEEEALHLPVTESGTLLEQKKSNTGS